MASMSTTGHLLAALALAASLLGGTGCLVHESHEYVVKCNASGIAEHDFATTDAAELSHVEGLLIVPRSGGQPSSLEPVAVRFMGTVAYASCQRPDATVAFLLAALR
jgi:hypothetical protein